MMMLRGIYDKQDAKSLLSNLIKSNIEIRFGQKDVRTNVERSTALKKVTELLNKKTRKPLVLLRGINKHALARKLIEKLNSNDSLYDGLFLVGDKAKNFLQKSDAIPHPIKRISSIGADTAAWIFKVYSSLANGPIDLSFFRDLGNKSKFELTVKNDQDLIDYYLFGLHTENSDRLVNFVSTTSSPEVALHNHEVKKIVIFLWLPKSYNFYIDYKKLKILSLKVKRNKLPVLKESFYPAEKEYSFKGFILPHYILAIHDLDENALILNPALTKNKSDWIEDGLEVNQQKFDEFIKSTAYKRFLVLTKDYDLVEKNID